MFKAPEEYWYLHCLSRWEKTAPPESHQGVKVSGQIEENTQTARVAYLLKMVDNGNGKTFRRLEERTQRKDGRSYISKDRSWMRQPYELNRGWYLEGNMSLHDKQTFLSTFRS